MRLPADLARLFGLGLLWFMPGLPAVAAERLNMTISSMGDRPLLADAQPVAPLGANFHTELETYSRVAGDPVWGEDQLLNWELRDGGYVSSQSHDFRTITLVFYELAPLGLADSVARTIAEPGLFLAERRVSGPLLEGKVGSHYLIATVTPDHLRLVGLGGEVPASVQAEFGKAGASYYANDVTIDYAPFATAGVTVGDRAGLLAAIEVALSTGSVLPARSYALLGGAEDVAALQAAEEQRRRDALMDRAVRQNAAEQLRYLALHPPLPPRTERFDLPDPFGRELAESLESGSKRTSQATDTYLAFLADALLQRCEVSVPLAARERVVNLGRNLVGASAGVVFWGYSQVLGAPTKADGTPMSDTEVAGLPQAYLQVFRALPDSDRFACNEAAIEALVLDTVEINRPPRSYLTGTVNPFRVACMQESDRGEADCACIEAFFVATDPNWVHYPMPFGSLDTRFPEGQRIRQACP